MVSVEAYRTEGYCAFAGPHPLRHRATNALITILQTPSPGTIVTGDGGQKRFIEMHESGPGDVHATVPVHTGIRDSQALAVCRGTRDAGASRPVLRDGLRSAAGDRAMKLEGGRNGSNVNRTYSTDSSACEGHAMWARRIFFSSSVI